MLLAATSFAAGTLWGWHAGAHNPDVRNAALPLAARVSLAAIMGSLAFSAFYLPGLIFVPGMMEAEIEFTKYGFNAWQPKEPVFAPTGTAWAAEPHAPMPPGP